MDTNVEPFAKHSSRSALGPHGRIQAPFFKQVLEEEREVLRDIRVDMLDGVAFGAKEYCELVVGLRDMEARAIIVEGVGPIGIGPPWDQEDGATIQDRDPSLLVIRRSRASAKS